MIPRLDVSPAGGYRLGAQDGYHLDVRPMIGLFRLVEVSEENQHRIGRFWCYQTFEAAVLAGFAWVAGEDELPVGWFRCGGARS